MGDDQEAPERGTHGVDSFRDNAEGIYVQAGIRFVQNGIEGIQEKHLQHFIALFLSPGETFVNGA